MPGMIGWPGLVVLILVALLIFGPKRLPEMGRSMGRGLREFKDSMTGGGRDDDPDELLLTAPEDEASVIDRRRERYREREQTL